MNNVIIEGTVVGIKNTEDTIVGILQINRDSGIADLVPFIISNNISVAEGSWIAIKGALKTSNIQDDATGKWHKYTYVAGHLTVPAGHARNSVEFEGYVVTKEPIRKTPKGKIIMDGVIAINHQKKSSSYPSIITWYETADKFSQMPIGQKVYVKGRFQSRRYTKVHPDGVSEERTAFEISVAEIEAQNE